MGGFLSENLTAKMKGGKDSSQIQRSAPTHEMRIRIIFALVQDIKGKQTKEQVSAWSAMESAASDFSANSFN